MIPQSIRELGELIATTFRLGTSPIAVHGADEPPDGGVFLPSIHRCLATAMVRMSTGDAPPVVYLGEDKKTGCCPGGLSHTGYIRRPPAISHFVSSGRPGVPDAPAEYLKANPELVDACFAAMGTITPPGRYLVVRTTESVPVLFTGVRALSFFGRAEQVRNLVAQVHFDRSEPFYPVLVPWGPACATLVTYPAGLAANTPPDSAFLGPQDPTLNYALPPDILGIGLPVGMARRVAENIGKSFITKRTEVAFPDHNEKR
ncbi:MAG: DUF169 domain-containing protein [Methanoregulaceae archaeon]|nr:DUF169 domain-containing protein [Methanoregulaceae archaeon]